MTRKPAGQGGGAPARQQPRRVGTGGANRQRLHPEAMRDDVVKRLRKLAGQLAGIETMYVEGRYCVDIVNQMAAARAGLDSVALIVLEDHINDCVRQAIEEREGDAKVTELMATLRRYIKSM